MQLANPSTYSIDLEAIRTRLEQLRKVVGGAERVALLLQDDPDPDGIASAIALRTVLGRNRATTPLFAFGETTRAENLAMLRLLDVSIEKVDTETLRAFPLRGVARRAAGVLRRPPGARAHRHRSSSARRHD